MLFEEDKNSKWTLLTQVKRPSRYLGMEWGSLPAKDEGANLVRFCLAFPDVYEVGMSYLGFQILYDLIKKLPFADVERAYCPWIDMEEQMRSNHTPLWGLESGRPLSDFDVVGFTLQYELTSTNILTMLDLGGIPLRSADRGEGSPLIFAGGPGALAPEPLAPFIDVFCVGDGEVLLPGALQLLSEMKGSSRRERLKALAALPGFYVPECPSAEVVKRQIISDPDASFLHTRMIVPNTSIVHDRVAVQVFRGCARGCRFCQAGMTERPMRERSADSVIAQIDALLQYSGLDEVGLLSLATCDWSQLETVIKKLSPMLSERKIKLSLPSLRMDSFSVELAAGLEPLRRGGLTFAPEAGSARLRNVINKGVSEEDIDASLDATFRHGWDRVKLYFMMGLPTETDEDLKGILEIINRASVAARRYKRKGDIAVSLAGYVPKAHTPFQWEPQLDRASLRERGRWVKGQIKSRKVALSYHEPDQTFLEGVFARGDRKLADVIEEAWRRGARFDGWSDTFDLGRWLSAFESVGIDPTFYTERRRDLDEALPWDHIDSGVTKVFLRKELERALSLTSTPECRLVCSACGWQGAGCSIQQRGV